MSTIRLSPAPVRQDGLRVGLIALACVEAFFALLQSLKLIAPDVPIETGHLAGQVTTAHLILAPILAAAAVVFAARDRLPHAVTALAAIGLTTWASELMSPDFTGITLVLANVVRPVVAVLAMIVAFRRTWLRFAAALVASLWLLWAWVSFLSDILRFFLGVIIYGA